MKVASIFPYQIKNRELFYDRNHNDVHFVDRNKYWDEQLKKSIEGHWINDEGTWVNIMPKLWWQINVFVSEVVYNKYGNKKISNLTLTDREWIINTYLLCCYGFSGYADDQFFTSNRIVDYIERGVHLDYKLAKKADDPTTFDNHGKRKKYIDPFEYLTEHYLVKEPQGKPLGKILYENDMLDAMMVGGRNMGKSVTIASFVSHEYFTGGIRDWADVGNLHTDPVRIGVGSVDSGKVVGFSKLLLDFYKNMPGEVTKGGVLYPSPLYRSLQGEWGTGNVIHEYTDKRTKMKKGSGSMLEFKVYGTGEGNMAIFVGGRRKLIIREEVGLLKNPITIASAEEETLKHKTDSLKNGIAIDLGTSGFLKHIEGVQTRFYEPARFGIFPVENKWEDENANIALFLPGYYAEDAYKDEQGNTKIIDAYNAAVDAVKLKKELHASGQEIRDFELNSPNWPSQMFMDSQVSGLCSDLARIRRLRLLERGCYRSIGDLVRDETGVVRFVENSKGIVIDSYTSKTTQQPKENNSWVFYEHPIKNAEKGLYRVTYDPIRNDGLGRTDDASLVSIIVRKGFDLSRRGKQNTVVGRWTGRKGTKDKNHELAIMVCEYYGCTVLHEEDIGDFVTYGKHQKKLRFFQPTPYIGSSMKVSGNAIYNFGVKIGDNDDLKPYAINLYNEHLETEIGWDDEYGVPLRNIDNMDDLMILDEIAKFGSGNFDNISAELIQMIWNKAEAYKVYGSGDSGEKKTKNSNAREMYELATSILGYADEYKVKF